MFCHVLSCSFMFFHVLSCSFMFFFFFFSCFCHFLSCSFMFLHFLSFPFIFFHFFSCSFMFFHVLSLFFFFFSSCSSFFLGCSKSSFASIASRFPFEALGSKGTTSERPLSLEFVTVIRHTDSRVKLVQTRLIEVNLLHVQNKPKTVGAVVKAPVRRATSAMTLLNRIGHDVSRKQVGKGR